MKQGRLIFLMLLAVTPMLAACDSGASTSGTKVSCTGRFEASIDRQTIVEADLRIDIEDSGKMTGTIKPASGADLPVVGEVQGQAISLAISLGNDQYIFGSGTFTQPPGQCTGVAGGAFAVETIKGIAATGRLSLLASPPQQPPAQVIIENNRLGIWGYAIGGSP